MERMVDCSSDISNHIYHMLSDVFPRLFDGATHMIDTQKKKSLEKEFIFNYFSDGICEKRYLLILPIRISENLRHRHMNIDRLIHETECCVFDMNHMIPLFIINRPIKYIPGAIIEKVNSYSNQYIFNNMMMNEKEFSDNIYFTKNHSGNKFVMFYDLLNNQWMFYTNNTILQFTKSNNLILYEHLYEYIDRFNRLIVHHIILIDNRLREIIKYPYSNVKQIIYIQGNLPKTLEYVDCSKNYNDFTLYNNHIQLSSIDHLKLYINVMEKKNLRKRKLIEKGLIMCINVNGQTFYMQIDTPTYTRLLECIPSNLTYHQIHLRLYQTDKIINTFQYLDENYREILKRINCCIETMSREILDIYHLTRNQNNPTLYECLPTSYKKIIYNLHNEYINQTYIYDRDLTIMMKVSVTIDDVIVKLKKMDTDLLANIIVDRDKLEQSINRYHKDGPISDYMMKNCIDAKIQSKLMSII